MHVPSPAKYMLPPKVFTCSFRFSKLHSILTVANLLAHNNISQISYCDQILLQSAAVNCSISDTFGGNIYFASDGTYESEVDNSFIILSVKHNCNFLECHNMIKYDVFEVFLHWYEYSPQNCVYSNNQFRATLSDREKKGVLYILNIYISIGRWDL